jgi:hypothetical protein
VIAIIFKILAVKLYKDTNKKVQKHDLYEPVMAEKQMPFIIYTGKPEYLITMTGARRV